MKVLTMIDLRQRYKAIDMPTGSLAQQAEIAATLIEWSEHSMHQRAILRHSWLNFATQPSD
jgi:hypothetical protein